MANSFNYGAARQNVKFANAKIYAPPGHNPRPNARIDFERERRDNVERAFALGSLQKSRLDVVEREAIRRSLLDGIMRFNQFKDVAVMHFQDVNGLFSSAHNAAPQAVWIEVRKLLDDMGNFVAYHRVMLAMRSKLFFLMFVPIDSVWVLVVIQVRHDNTLPNPRADRVALEASRIMIYDVVANNRNNRDQVIRQRIGRILGEGDITIPAGSIQSQPGLPMVADHQSGFIIHDIAMRLIERIDGLIARTKITTPGPIADLVTAVHNNTAVTIFGGIFFNTPGDLVGRARGRMIGNILTGASIDNNWQAISAIELPGRSERGGDFRPQDMCESIVLPVVAAAVAPDGGDDDDSGSAMDVDDDADDADDDMQALVAAARESSL